jgi:hypothetical protein
MLTLATMFFVVSFLFFASSYSFVAASFILASSFNDFSSF